jgi:YbbR domain-containing protein
MAWHPFRNVGLKAAAICVSTLLWFAVSGQQVERSVSVPVLYARVPSGLQMTGYRFEQVTAHLRGGYTQMSQLGRDDVKLVVDLSAAQPGQTVVNLRTDQVEGAPLGIEVTDVEPRTLTVTIEQMSTAPLTVVAVVEGEPAPGFAIGQVTVEPAHVLIAGPINRLKANPSIATEPVSVAGATSTVTRTVNLALSDPELRLTDIRQVRVVVPISRRGGS